MIHYSSASLGYIFACIGIRTTCAMVMDEPFNHLDETYPPKKPNSTESIEHPLKTYIVVYSDVAFLGGDEPQAEIEGTTLAAGGEVKHVYENVLKGAAVTLTANAAKALRMNPSVESVTEDAMAYIQVNQWGQDRMDQCDSVLDGAPYTPLDAADVKIYVLDNGIWGAHDDFAGGMIDPESTCHKSFIEGEPPLQANQPNAHGTHVASTICGNRYGIAACGTAKLCDVKVLASYGSGSWAGVIAGIDYAAADCAEHDGPCVINMSLGGNYVAPVNQAVANAVAAGISVVVAAGNSNGLDSCNFSPASEPSAITVGATQQGDELADFTNVGPCVDAFAPGVGITAAWSGSTFATRTIRGTSMASPMVAGLAAAKLHADQSLSPSEVKDIIKADVTRHHVSCDFPNTGIVTIGGMKCTDANPMCPDGRFCASQPNTKLIKVQVFTDSFPSETSWSLTNTCTGAQVALGGLGGSFSGSTAQYTSMDCYDKYSAYNFTINDLGGDGMQSQYGYRVTFSEEFVAQGSNDFKFDKTVSFGSCDKPSRSRSGKSHKGNTRRSKMAGIEDSTSMSYDFPAEEEYLRGRK